MAKMLVAATGVVQVWQRRLSVFCGREEYNLERCFNVRDGFDRKDDKLPRDFSRALIVEYATAR